MALFYLPTGFEDKLSLATSYTQTARARLVEFGDGYTQRTPLGNNLRIRNLSAVWENLTQIERDTLLNTLEYCNASGEPLYMPQSNALPRPGKFYVESIDIQMSDNVRVTVSASLREVFDL